MVDAVFSTSTTKVCRREHQDTPWLPLGQYALGWVFGTNPHTARETLEHLFGSPHISKQPQAGSAMITTGVF